MDIIEKQEKQQTHVDNENVIEHVKTHSSACSVVSSENEHYRQPPDGGLKAWLVVLGGFCSFFSAIGYGNCWGVFLDEYNANVYPGQQTALSWIGGLWSSMCNITGPIYPWLLSKTTDRKLVACSVILSPLALMMGSITNQVWQLYITQGVMSGVGASLAWYSGMTGPQRWFSKRRGLAIGITLSASGIGGLAFSYISQAAIEQIGWRWALRILGFMQFALLIVSTITAYPLNPSPKNVPLFDFSSFKNKQFYVLVVVHFFSGFAFYVPSGYVPSYSRAMGFNPWLGANLNAMMSIFMFVGKVSLGFCSDYIGHFNMTFICAAIAAIAHLAVWMTAKAEASMWAFAVLYGMFGGSYIAMVAVIITHIVDFEHIETGTGWCYFAWCISGLFGQPIVSQIISHTDYTGGIAFNGSLFAVCAILVLVLRIWRGGCTILKKV